MNNTQAQIYSRVTDIIIKQLESGTIAWRKQWLGGIAPTNLISRQAYTGINLWILLSQKYTSPYWLSYKQMKYKGGKMTHAEYIKKTPIIFFEPNGQYMAKEIDEETGEEKLVKRQSRVLRYYDIYNVQQTSLIEGKDYKNETKNIEFSLIQQAENLIAEYSKSIPIKHEIQRAFYSPTDDYINMPQMNSFTNEEAYYNVLFHEMTHSTGHKTRLNRANIQQLHSFGDREYSKEELTAEMGASYLSSMAGIEQATLSNNVAYIQGWLKALKNDKTLLISAGGKAQKAVEYITNYKLPVAI